MLNKKSESTGSGEVAVAAKFRNEERDAILGSRKAGEWESPSGLGATQVMPLRTLRSIWDMF